MSTEFPSSYYETRFLLARDPECLPASFAIITAHNPMNRRWSPRMNRKADLRLKRLLERKQIPHFRATGQSPDGSHAEPGWAVHCGLRKALGIAGRYKQLAIWWIDGDELSLIHYSGSSGGSIGSFAERIVS